MPADDGVLDGVTVVDPTTYITGGFATTMLANQGAEVIKVERPGRGDDMRHAGPPFVPTADGDDPGRSANDNGESPYFWTVNYDKRSVAFDLGTEAGRAALLDLASEADVFVENFRPGTADRLGIAYEDVREVNPEVVYCSVSAFGETGPWAGRPGYDLLVQGSSGIMSVTGPEGGEPCKVGLPAADLITAMWVAFGVVGALLRRERTGEGDRIEIGMHDAVLPWLTKQAARSFVGETPTRMGTRDPVLAPYQTYPTADGHLVVACANRKLWRELCEAIDRPDLLDDERFRTNADRVEHMDELEAELAPVFRERPTDEWVARLADDHGLPVGPVNTVGEAIDNEQTRTRGAIGELDHPTAGRIRALEHPLNFENAASGFDAPPPLLGEDTEAVLRELGYDDEDVAALRKAGAIP